VKCITGARYTMKATLLVQSHPDVSASNPTSVTFVQDRGQEVEIVQDPISGTIERRWRPAATDGTQATMDLNDPSTQVHFKCSAKGFPDGGLRLVGSDERFSPRGYVETVDSLTLKYPASVEISRRDRIYNIRDAKSGDTIWKEDNGNPTVFEVIGFDHITDPFGKVIEHSALIHRAQVQDDLT
jgi:hypothetical protein